MAKIRHIAIVTDRENIEKLVEFYTDVFEMQVTQRYDYDDPKGGGVFMTDGYLQVAILLPNPKRPKGIDHFGFTADPGEIPAIHAKLAKHGVKLFKPPTARPFVEDGFLDVDGNKVDLTTDVLRPQDAVLAQQARS
jgi:catechol 2,3-dioxygenase-like lactoylglutathione lyase family enzyme